MNEIVVNFYWLLELFSPGGERSLRYYAKSVAGFDAVTTQDSEEAKRFTQAEAEALVPTLLSKSGVWRAMEHGFLEAPA